DARILGRHLDAIERLAHAVEVGSLLALDQPLQQHAERLRTRRRASRCAASTFSRCVASIGLPARAAPRMTACILPLWLPARTWRNGPADGHGRNSGHAP